MASRNLDIEALRALVAIADTGSFSTAALQLGRTQSAVSLQIKRLEEMLGQTLLSRVRGRVDGTTAEGRELISYARQMLRLNDEAYNSVAQHTASGTLRVGLPEELMESVFPSAMSRFQALYPRMRLQLKSATSVDLIATLDHGELDLILFKHCERLAPTAASTVWQEPLVWMVGEAHAAGLSTPISLALFGENCAFRIAATGALAKAKVAWQLAYSGSSTTGLRHAVRCGLGITALPRSLLIPGMVVVEAGLPSLPDARISARHAPGQEHPVAERFVALLREELQSQRGTLNHSGFPGHS